MEYLIICLAAILTSGLTLFSGFGLGTLLMPVFALFFPIDEAVAMTAIVHFLNNAFKFALLGKDADRDVITRFGMPAVLASFLGAWMLIWLSGLDPLLSYELLNRVFHIMPVKIVIAFLMVMFAVIELIPGMEKLSFGREYLPVGGLFSGFFGGLSGHQGALRSAFLVRCGLSKEAFIASGVVIACLVDMTRLSVYFTHFSMSGIGGNKGLLFAAVISAFTGTFIGNRLVKKITMRTIQGIVSLMLFMIAIALGVGII